VNNWYVVSKNGKFIDLLAGPFESQDAAEGHVEPCQTLALEVDQYSIFYDFGVGRLPGEWEGRFNQQLGIAA
jgi:uncharacterized ParB-like nuclease family protein